MKKIGVDELTKKADYVLNAIVEPKAENINIFLLSTAVGETR